MHWIQNYIRNNDTHTNEDYLNSLTLNLKSKIDDLKYKADQNSKLFDEVLEFLYKITRGRDEFVSRWEELRTRWHDLLNENKRNALSLCKFISVLKNDMLPFLLDSNHPARSKREYIETTIIPQLEDNSKKASQIQTNFDRFKNEVNTFMWDYQLEYCDNKSPYQEALNERIRRLQDEIQNKKKKSYIQIAFEVVFTVISIVVVRYLKFRPIAHLANPIIMNYCFQEKEPAELENFQSEILKSEDEIKEIRNGIKSFGDFWAFSKLLMEHMSESINDYQDDNIKDGEIQRIKNSLGNLESALKAYVE
ncbi:5720_t:CDS:2 [Ambispora leptoticha]|uniref:5720_t:CDS:1 n=1 Tax=Ambispora leptoticha TaxID=144679 RepID=A0A9N9BHE5_9GLOM|nr:5720_t:CDS:2 [Ambispora leptoticha]